MTPSGNPSVEAGNTINNWLTCDQLLASSNILECLPAGICVCDNKGTIQQFNQQAVALWGRKPRSGDAGEQFSGAWHLLHTDGTSMPHDKSPMAACLEDGIPRKNVEIGMERPDGTSISVKMNVIPIRDPAGNMAGIITHFEDITEQVRIAKTLDRKTRELQDYVDNAAIGLHWVDARGIIQWANQAELNMLGYSAEEYIDHHISEFHVSSDTVHDMLERLGANQTLRSYESVLRCRDGSLRHVQISSNVLWEDGRFIHTRCFTVDVTQQQQLFTALSDSELRYRQLVQGLPAAIYTCDSHGYITQFNDAAVALWGRKPEPGKDLWCGSWKIYHADGRPMLAGECPMAVTLQEGRPIEGQEIIIERPDGSRRYVASWPRPLFDSAGQLTGAVNMLIDITGSKLAEHTLRESEERFHRMTDQSPMMVFTEDLSGQTIYANTAMQEFTGLRQPDLAGKGWQQAIQWPRIADQEVRLLTGGSTETFQLSYPFRHANGRDRWVQHNRKPLFTSGGHTSGYINVLTDIHDAWELLQKKDEFISVASHELKTPVTSLKASVQLLQQRTKQQQDAVIQELLDKSHKSVNKMISLINDMLHAAQLNNHETTLYYEYFSINELLLDVTEHARVLDPGCTVTVEGQWHAPVYADKQRIQQVIINLTSNAIKYSPGGTADIRFEMTETPDEWQLAVHDKGIGIPPDKFTQIFERFCRLENPQFASGLGLGLLICSQLIAAHKGRIWVESVLGTGSSFFFSLPKRQATAPL